MKVVTNKDETSKVVYTTAIIRDIIDCALSDISGVVKYPENSKLARDSVKIEQVNDDIFIDVFIKLYHTASVHDVASRIQNVIKSTLESMTEFTVNAVNVHVIDVEFEEN
jgi:uncharacterized alkaline shock family protein YloU